MARNRNNLRTRRYDHFTNYIESDIRVMLNRLVGNISCQGSSCHAAEIASTCRNTTSYRHDFVLKLSNRLTVHNVQIPLKEPAFRHVQVPDNYGGFDSVAIEVPRFLEAQVVYDKIRKATVDVLWVRFQGIDLKWHGFAPQGAGRDLAKYRSMQP